MSGVARQDDDRSLTARLLLELARCTQGDVAAHLGVSTAQMSRMLTGKRHMSQKNRDAFVAFLVGRISTDLIR